jgi:hypothetical protein
MKNALIFIAIIQISTLAVGCATMNNVNPMPAEVDTKVKNMQTPSEKSLVYVMRPTFIGKPFGTDITANDEYVGTTQGGIYVYAVLAPGDYIFKVTGHDNNPEIMLKLEPNKTYYIHQGVYPGLLKGIGKLEIVTQEEGKKSLQECTLGDKLGKNIAN